jgi:dolichyl-phosphate-mannose-protein mannosyltransferase
MNPSDERPLPAKRRRPRNQTQSRSRRKPGGLVRLSERGQGKRKARKSLSRLPRPEPVTPISALIPPPVEAESIPVAPPEDAELADALDAAVTVSVSERSQGKGKRSRVPGPEPVAPISRVIRPPVEAESIPLTLAEDLAPAEALEAAATGGVSKRSQRHRNARSTSSRVARRELFKPSSALIAPPIEADSMPVAPPVDVELADAFDAAVRVPISERVASPEPVAPVSTVISPPVEAESIPVAPALDLAPAEALEAAATDRISKRIQRHRKARRPSSRVPRPEPVTSISTLITLPVEAESISVAPLLDLEPAPAIQETVTPRIDFAVRLREVAASRWLLSTSSLVLIAGTAAYVRFAGLSQIGFNSDEAVYSGQAAAIAGFQPYGQLFGVFRAHPLLVQFIAALGYAISGHVNDWIPRAVTASFGVALALICWGIGTALRGRFLGLAMGMIAALCPYAVLISRQMLLDGPMTTFVAATMLMLALWLRSHRVMWFYAGAAMAGLAVLSKETGLLTVPAMMLFMLFSRDLPLRWWRDLPIAALVFGVAISPYPLSLVLGGGAHTTNQFLIWQFFRHPNHDSSFYLSVLPSLGYVTLLLAVFGLASLRWRWHTFDAFAIALVLCYVAFFEAWPTKGFEYLLPILPPVVYLAGRGAMALGEIGSSLARPLYFQRLEWRWAAAAALALALISMAPPAVGAAASARQSGAAAEISTDSDLSEPGPAVHGFLAGTGGLQASRPAGEWIRTHTLPSTQFMTIGPSFANVIQFYGQRKALALSVSPNPLRHNPQYEPLLNPDAAIRSGSIQYLVYDSYSASRSPFFAKQLLSYVKKFRGVPVYEYRQGNDKNEPADVVIYEVHP